MTTSPALAAATRRLRPLRIALVLEGIAPWVPVEKIFMTQLGFTPALFALMATAYGATVPLLEIPSGILADRWSRRGVLMLASIASLASVVVGGLSHNVTTYLVSAMLLGVYFAMQSGTVDAIVYDTLIEEVGDAGGFEKLYGRTQTLSSLALTASSLAGGAVAALLSARDTYLLTIPTSVIGIIVLTRFREPTLHRTHDKPRLRAHLAATWHTAARRPGVAPIALAMMLAAATTQMLFEFGPLWLVAAAVPTVLFGPYTAAMTSTLGFGGLLAGRVRLQSPALAGTFTLVMTAAGLTLALTTDGPLVIAAQVLLIGLLATISIHLSRLLHELVPSQQRSAISSGIGTMSWLTFLPCSLLFGALGGGAGIRAAGWIITALVAVAGLTLTRIAGRGARQTSEDAETECSRSDRWVPVGAGVTM
ncbi:MAG TPA: MFS transporter [Frankiaceae bacterium]|jgi:MFS family permease|nr:MFS transporter [Frankiaceae bacterium]